MSHSIEQHYDPFPSGSRSGKDSTFFLCRLGCQNDTPNGSFEG